MMTNLTKKAFGRLIVVGELGLSHNRFNNISLYAFEGLIQLTKLDLSHNNLTYIPPGAFQSKDMSDMSISYQCLCIQFDSKVKNASNATQKSNSINLNYEGTVA